MLATARERNADEKFTYRRCGIEDYDYPENTWDVVASNLALHYIEDLDTVLEHVARTLKPGGVFVFNIEHPTFTAGIKQDWLYDEQGQIVCWPLDRYYEPGIRHTKFLGCDVVKYHHTLTQILMGLLHCGFTLEAVEEAGPSEELLDLPGMRDELRRPMMLLVRVKISSNQFQLTPLTLKITSRHYPSSQKTPQGTPQAAKNSPRYSLSYPPKRSVSLDTLLFLRYNSFKLTKPQTKENNDEF